MSSDSTGATGANSSAKNNTKQNMCPPVESLLLDKAEIWIQGILPLVGVGQYGFVGAVNKKMNQLYKEYSKVELKKNPREVLDGYPSRPAEITDTLYGETFCNQPRAEYWLRDNSSNKAPRRSQVCTVIAKSGNLTVMQWARQQGFPWDAWTCASAAKNGHLEMLQWLHANGCPWNADTCICAAEGGHFEILKWARENGCPWSARTCDGAAKNGQLEILMWARENGCPWNAITCAGAAKNGHLEMLQWLHAMVVHGMHIHVSVLLRWSF
ncbi:ankyrin repeat protein [Seminavis robusta]|uniref:Ankyrin repeat protein n=1 Tax=Seminavis robusta TaxID=568900 RepID=A0A9N8EGT8_9STRA|nr:ankyrin repeat protein [Seminavis robusta]|eukprot:Sro1106_g242020.1 ankyrin repeat protein (269) ;mRNA; r:20824-21630